MKIYIFSCLSGNTDQRKTDGESINGDSSNQRNSAPDWCIRQVILYIISADVGIGIDKSIESVPVKTGRIA